MEKISLNTDDMRYFKWEDTSEDMFEPSYTYRTYNGYVSYGYDPGREGTERPYVVVYNEYVPIHLNALDDYLFDHKFAGDFETLAEAKIFANKILMKKLDLQILSYLVAQKKIKEQASRILFNFISSKNIM